MRTYSPKPADISRQWHVIDAEDVVLGRLAVQAATLLRGKHKPTYAPHVDGGDFVIIVNADKVSLSGQKRTDKLAYRHSGYPGGLKSIAYGDLLEKDARKAIEKSVRGHAPQEPPRPPAHQEAEGLRRPRAPARRPEAPAVRDQADLPVMTEETTVADTETPDTGADVETEIETNAEGVAYTSETSPSADVPDKPATIAPAAATGRRKEAIARVRIVPGTGEWTVNGKKLEEYLPNKLHQQIAKEAFAETGLDGRFDVIARVTGGGMTGQAGALRLGVARALNLVDEEANRPVLKKAGLLTRDSRIKERKKAGLKKARKAPQYSKR